MSLNNFFSFFSGIYRAVDNFIRFYERMPEIEKTLTPEVPRV